MNPEGIFNATSALSQATLALAAKKDTLRALGWDLKNLKLTGIQLQLNLTNKNKEINELISQKEQCEYNIQNYQGQINDVQAQLEDLEREIQRLQIIANEPSPPEKWGNYCVNGHLNCPNLPSKVHVLGNEAEIEAHKQKVAEALRELSVKRAEYNSLASRLQDLKSAESAAEIELQNIQIRYSSEEYALEVLQNEVNQIQDSIQQKNAEYESAELEVSQCENILAAAQQKVLNLNQGPQLLQPAAAAAPSSYQEMLTAMAQREIEEERAEEERIHQMAVRELLEEERLRSSVDDVVPADGVEYSEQGAQNMERSVLQRVVETVAGVRSPMGLITQNLGVIAENLRNQLAPTGDNVLDQIDEVVGRGSPAP